MAPTSRCAATYDATICQGPAYGSGLERVYRRRLGAAGRAGENAARAGTKTCYSGPNICSSEPWWRLRRAEGSRMNQANASVLNSEPDLASIPMAQGVLAVTVIRLCGTRASRVVTVQR